MAICQAIPKSPAATEGNRMPAISVILPVYNAASFLGETMASIQGQTFTDYEVLCVDDGSTDTTPSLLARYAQADHRIRVIRQENSGPGKARNTGLAHASGDYVLMLDSDDIYDEQMFDLMHKRAIETEADMVVCRSTLFDDKTGVNLDSSWVVKNNQLPHEDTFTPKDIQDFAFTAFMGWPWDKLYKRSLIEDHHLRYPSLNNSEDLYLVFLSIVLANKISVIDQSLISHRMNRAGSVSASRASAPLDFYKSICLLKYALKEKGLLERYSWSFFNWAFEYLVWNIDTMDDSGGRKVQLEALANGEFSELELERRSGSYLSLNPKHHATYMKLLREAYGIKQPPSDAGKRSLLGHLISFLTRVDADGWVVAIKAFLSYRVGRLLRKNTDPVEPKIVRSSDYMITNRKSLIDHDASANGGNK
ncbi:MAG: glycosyltransferase family 2 protein [Parolsenella sp.]|uniref:glycosyltransferase family 2 protein n=1 Tax=Parolsenella sp. TaxID=2083006 RepID=UPI002A74E572|nr:glycosyltransferase family 2 protein [Parolsenella sp.]MCI5950131.1 glycosyltransferase [Coriobacteriaceae bacterium]MDY3292080.1 glycosyltransferase family 2 protein [Parolsenella sp.]